jgi:hypothetical protein
MVRRANRVDGLGTEKTGESLALFIPGRRDGSNKYTGFGKLLDQIRRRFFRGNIARSRAWLRLTRQPDLGEPA